MKKKIFFYSFIVLSIFLLDRITKMCALTYCAIQSIMVTPYLSFSLAYNRGMAWSLAESNDTYVFVFVTMLVLCITLWIALTAYWRYSADKNIVGESIIIAGSIGNLYDRFVMGGVVDFIELSYKGWYWPVFNIADIAVVVGVVIMMYIHGKKEG